MIGLVAGTGGFVPGAAADRSIGEAEVGVLGVAAFVAVSVVVGAGELGGLGPGAVELGGRGPVLGLTALKLGVAGVRDCML